VNVARSRQPTISAVASHQQRRWPLPVDASGSVVPRERWARRIDDRRQRGRGRRGGRTRNRPSRPSRHYARHASRRNRDCEEAHRLTLDLGSTRFAVPLSEHGSAASPRRRAAVWCRRAVRSRRMTSLAERLACTRRQAADRHVRRPRVHRLGERRRLRGAAQRCGHERRADGAVRVGARRGRALPG
jgi:hypothetical protein